MANTDFRDDLNKIDILDVWGEGQIITGDGMITGFPRSYIINLSAQELSNESVDGPMVAKKGTPLTEIIDPELFLGVASYEDPSFPIDDGIVDNITLMGAPIIDKTAKEIWRVLNKDNGRVILYDPSDDAKKVLEKNCSDLFRGKEVDKFEEVYNVPTIRPMIVYEFVRHDEL